MAFVTDLKLEHQPGTTNTFFATWKFDDTYRSTTSVNTKTVSSVAVGKWVKIKSGATYYNGVAIPNWVMQDTWQIIELIGDRAVIHRNKSGTHAIMSPINVRYLTGITSTSTTTNTVVKYNTLDHYEVKWSYDPGNGVWFTGSTTNTTDKNATYTPPANATRFKVSVKPVSKTYKQNNNDYSYWAGYASTKTYYVNSAPPEIPSAPTVTIEGYELTASLENISDARTDRIEFQIVVNDSMVVKSGVAAVRTRTARFKCPIDAGFRYKARCRAINLVGWDHEVYGEWGTYSSNADTMPAAVSMITSCRATSETSVRVQWTSAKAATTYDIEYTTDKKNFDTSDETTMKTGITQNYHEITGLDSGFEYYFRVRATNSKGSSSWSDVKSVKIGKKPAAPTTWSSTSTAVTNELVTLYWVHNSQDNSSETAAQVDLVINGTTQPLKTIQNTDTGEDIDKTKSLVLRTSSYTAGTIIKWRVRTKGILSSYGDWSVQRVITVYAPPTLEFKMTNSSGTDITTLTSFPFRVYAKAGPSTQKPTGYHLTIVSNDIYETTDNIGNSKTINKGEEVFSKYYNTTTFINPTISAGDVNLDNGISYTLICVASMNSGLTVESSIRFRVSWEEKTYEPDAEISVDMDTFVAYIVPFCIDEDETPIRDVVLSVYRREFDGKFTELATNISSTSNTTISDPHPSLDYARYRIVATSKQTGAVSFYDAPGYPVKGVAVIIQWDDDWSDFDAVAEDGEDEMEEKPWSGSMLKLPYNIDVTESNNKDVDLVEYIGREHPVSYYGTQLGSADVWTMEIPKEDKETLYALRRLSVWMGDVYVREPSGCGYWANISVSMSQTHCEVTIPVTLTLRRVEGGV